MRSKGLNIFIRCLLLAWTLLLTGMTEVSANPLAHPMDCGQTPIRVGFVEFGFLYFIENGQEKGIDKDIANELAKRSGCAFAPQIIPRARAFAQIEGSQLDMIVTATSSPERERSAWFVPFAATKIYTLIPA